MKTEIPQPVKPVPTLVELVSTMSPIKVGDWIEGKLRFKNFDFSINENVRKFILTVPDELSVLRVLPLIKEVENYLIERNENGFSFIINF